MMFLVITKASFNEYMLRGAERIWPPSNEAQPNGEGMASGSATQLYLENKKADLSIYL